MSDLHKLLCELQSSHKQIFSKSKITFDDGSTHVSYLARTQFNPVVILPQNERSELTEMVEKIFQKRADKGILSYDAMVYELEQIHQRFARDITQIHTTLLSKINEQKEIIYSLRQHIRDLESNILTPSSGVPTPENTEPVQLLIQLD
jgi:hypothetical protein